jgi:hypothetical protein
MELKNYQRNTLHILRSFFEQCRILGHEEAFKKISSEPETAARLAVLKNGYTLWDKIPHTPRVCLKVPTGGGKTIIAAHAIKIAGETWLFLYSEYVRRPVVLSGQLPIRGSVTPSFFRKKKVEYSDGGSL